MLTSFAPSPIASVVFSGFLFLIIKTTSAFYFGLTLHASTTLAPSQRSTNLDSISLSYCIVESVSPATMTAFCLTFLVYVCDSKCFSISEAITLASLAWRINIFISLSRSLQEWPIFMAVSTLSPVRTQTLIVAFLISAMVSPTSSYSLSSIAVDPINSKSTSSSSET